MATASVRIFFIAYEYLMRQFVTESGKSKGQFYTPSEVSQILAKVVGISKETSQDQTVIPLPGLGRIHPKQRENGAGVFTLFFWPADRWIESMLNPPWE